MTLIFSSPWSQVCFLDVQPFTQCPQDSKSPRERLLHQHLILVVPSGDKCVVIPLKGYFEQESIMLTDSREFILHLDCLKNAIKKQSNLLVQSGWERQKLFFN